MQLAGIFCSSSRRSSFVIRRNHYQQRRRHQQEARRDMLRPLWLFQCVIKNRCLPSASIRFILPFSFCPPCPLDLFVIQLRRTLASYVVAMRYPSAMVCEPQPTVRQFCCRSSLLLASIDRRTRRIGGAITEKESKEEALSETSIKTHLFLVFGQSKSSENT